MSVSDGTRSTTDGPAPLAVAGGGVLRPGIGALCPLLLDDACGGLPSSLACAGGGGCCSAAKARASLRFAIVAL